MKYNSKYDRWVTKGGLVYRYDKKNDKLVLCKLTTNTIGYLLVRVAKPKRTQIRVHRLVYETFISEVPQCYEIDHINTIRNDNRLENLRCVTHKENMNNPLSKNNNSVSKKGLTWSDFGNKFKEHYGITYNDNPKLYDREKHWYCSHNKTCRWES